MLPACKASSGANPGPSDLYRKDAGYGIAGNKDVPIEAEPGFNVILTQHLWKLHEAICYEHERMLQQILKDSFEAEAVEQPPAGPPATVRPKLPLLPVEGQDYAEDDPGPPAAPEDRCLLPEDDDINFTNVVTLEVPGVHAFPEFPHDPSRRTRAFCDDDDVEYQPWPEWLVVHHSGPCAGTMGSFQLVKKKDRSMTKLLMDDDEVVSRSQGIINPNTRLAFAWTACFLLMAAWELFAFPLEFAFFPADRQGADDISEIYAFLDVMSFFTIIFWTVDLVVSFFTGYYDNAGKLVLTRREVVHQYLTTWFLPDALVIVMDWILLLGQFSGAQPMALAKLGKGYARIMRLARVTRLRKAAQMYQTASTIIESEVTTICMTILTNLLILFVLAHSIGCFWFALGNQENGWVASERMDDRAWQYQYLTTLHWSLTQFTPGSMAVQPSNTQERFYAVCVLFLGMLVFSGVVSSITGALVNLKNLGTPRRSKIREMRCFLLSYRIEGHLKNRCMSFMNYNVDLRTPSMDRDLLKMLPRALRDDVLLNMYKDRLYVHPLFGLLHAAAFTIMQDICNLSLKEVMTFADDAVFHIGCAAKSMLIVKSGVYEYVQSPKSTQVVRENACLSEAILWVPWVHMGTLISVNNGRVLDFDPDAFRKTLLDEPRVEFFARTYAQRFSDGLNKRTVDLYDYSVTIVSARGLPAADEGVLISGKSDPYVTCEAIGRRSTRFKTPVVNNTLDPVFSVTGRICDLAGDEVLAFAVYDQDIGKKDDFLGSAVIYLDRIVGDSFEGELELIEATSRSESSYLSVCLQQESSQCDVDRVPSDLTMVMGALGAAPREIVSGILDGQPFSNVRKVQSIRAGTWASSRLF
mmetsp:Transcript_373/g.857  ORF Transcript_373/g.857 Transcript_373/m.857 type:complete len:865 (-) Transcript_373:25-2619(-)